MEVKTPVLTLYTAIAPLMGVTFPKRHALHGLTQSRALFRSFAFKTSRSSVKTGVLTSIRWRSKPPLGEVFKYKKHDSLQQFVYNPSTASKEHPHICISRVVGK